MNSLELGACSWHLVFPRSEHPFRTPRSRLLTFPYLRSHNQQLYGKYTGVKERSLSIKARYR